MSRKSRIRDQNKLPLSRPSIKYHSLAPRLLILSNDNAVGAELGYVFIFDTDTYANDYSCCKIWAKLYGNRTRVLTSDDGNISLKYLPFYRDWFKSCAVAIVRTDLDLSPCKSS